MANNALLKTLLKAAMPTVRKFIESGRIDGFFSDLKSKYKEIKKPSEGESVEILITTEEDGCEYANVVFLDRDLRVTEVLDQQKLTELINSLLTQAEI